MTSKNPPGYKVISTGYTPRPLQAELHRKLRRFSTLVCHRRFGKTVFAVNEMINRALTANWDTPQVAYIGPTYGQTKRVAWTMLKKFCEPLPGQDPNEADLMIKIPRPWKKDTAKIMLLGAENWKSLKGIYLNFGVLDEAADMHPSAWTEAIRPTLSDTKGSALFIGTPRGRNSFYELYKYGLESGDPEWFSALYRADETGIIDSDELSSLRRTMSEDEYNQEYLCDFTVGMQGSYFAKELAKADADKRVGSVPYDPALPVDTYWDLGMNDVTGIWFVQPMRTEFRIIKYIEAPDTSIPEWLKNIQKTGYYVRNYFLPHDAQVRELGTGKSRIETFRSLGVRPKVIPRVEDKLDSINAARIILAKCHFDREGCKRGLEALAAYQRRWDSQALTFSPKPLHNWASNGADAFQQFAMGAKEERSEQEYASLPRQAEMDWDIFKHS